MNYQGDKLVDFFKWCPLCEEFITPETELPCRECMEQPINANTSKPVLWKEKDKKSSH